MSLWQFRAIVEGHRRANSVEDEKPPAPTDAEHDELMAKYG